MPIRQTKLTSIRIPLELLQALEQLALVQKQRKNTLILKALSLYVESMADSHLAAEAKRQSLLASRMDSEDEAWEANTDNSDWD